MPRKQFIADLQKAQSEDLPIGIKGLQSGEDDGQFDFWFTVAEVDVRITALVPDLTSYPSSHEYILFSADNAPSNVAHALQAIRRAGGKTVFDLLQLVSATLCALSSQSEGDHPILDSQIDEDVDVDDGNDEYDDCGVYDSDHEAFQLPRIDPSHQPTNVGTARTANKAFRHRVRADICAAKQAGFRVGVLGDLWNASNTFLSLSVRMSKLGISDAAMQAWQIHPSDYLILILQYPNGYKTSEEIQGLDSIRLESNLGIRVCAGKNYKPTFQEAITAFTAVSNNDHRDANRPPESQHNPNESSIQDLFISRPLNQMFKECFVPILRFRALGLPWNGAERLYTSRSSLGPDSADFIDDGYFLPEQSDNLLPDIVTADHYATGGTATHSMPLLAMQFLLRHFARCTEFCLVCHRRLHSDLEAIKPYVCDSPLCLYQYMTLGFGPSIEHEIAAQPYVVDLLVSFCYNSAFTGKLKEFPDGLSLLVPPVNPLEKSALDAIIHHNSRLGRTQPEPYVPDVSSVQLAQSIEVGFDSERNEINFHKVPHVCRVRRGDWIVIKPKGSVEWSELHCRVSDTTYFPIVAVNSPVLIHDTAKSAEEQTRAAADAVKKPSTRKPASPARTPQWIPSTFQIYSEDFKCLSDSEKCIAICRLLDTVPDVKLLQHYVSTRPSADLKNWGERISPAALGVLRWIIASNRACIMEVDSDAHNATAMHPEERVQGMKDWMQFRFAMGAPDKEQRFINEVRKTADRLESKYPTLFAWHGSPLCNWHMIIREGLHYKNVDHGRAYGNGVYHALEAGTSTSYSHMGYVGPNRRSERWPNSILRISHALALNEIVNAPEEFVSSKPYYVVRQLDWIQTRYLFVQCSTRSESIRMDTDVPIQNALVQDPQRIPRGISDPIVIPASAIKSHGKSKGERRPCSPSNPSPPKKQRLEGSWTNPIPLDDDDNDSVATDVSDLNIFAEDDPIPEAKEKTPEPVTKSHDPPTDFLPGSLDFGKLPLMPMPTYATSATTRRLMREVQAITKVQNATPLADLGWYVDVEKIENVYQWIVELHSFHTFEIAGKKLPLAGDMAEKAITSVVLEVRFNKDFPFTPPYVRVIRPRFLSLVNGGGGHIVMGGAMCMELLTNTGWSSVSSLESVLMQIRMAIASEPFARLDMGNNNDYGTSEAAEGYLRACERHGWQVPPGFKEMALGMSVKR